MASTLYRPSTYSLSDLIGDIERGTLALPDIQRPFVWSPSKCRDLLDSMYRGFPIGTLMFWETGADVGTRQIGGGENDRVPRLLIVDGQQRVTSLYAVLTGTPVLTRKFEDLRISIAFRPSDETFEVTDAAIRRDAEFIPDITELWEGGYKSALRGFMAKLEESRDEPLDDDIQDELEERIDRVRDLRNFPFQVIELSPKADEEQVAEIFRADQQRRRPAQSSRLHSHPHVRALGEGSPRARTVRPRCGRPRREGSIPKESVHRSSP